LLQYFTTVLWVTTTVHLYAARLLSPENSVIAVCVCVCTRVGVRVCLPPSASQFGALSVIFGQKTEASKLAAVLTCDSMV